jgi:hypothetical protein
VQIALKLLRLCRGALNEDKMKEVTSLAILAIFSTIPPTILSFGSVARTFGQVPPKRSQYHGSRNENGLRGKLEARKCEDKH